MKMTVELASIDRSGGVASLPQGLPVAVKENCEATASLYRLAGYEVPWIGYVSLIDGRVVGGGAFKGPPRDNRVEIAYYTLQEFERVFSEWFEIGPRYQVPGTVRTLYAMRRRA